MLETICTKLHDENKMPTKNRVKMDFFATRLNLDKTFQ